MSFVKTISLGFIFVGLLALSATEADASWLIATQSESVRAGTLIVIDIVQPENNDIWPRQLKLVLSGKNDFEEVELVVVEPLVANSARQSYRTVLPSQLSGIVRAELVGVKSNRLILLVTKPDVIVMMQTRTVYETGPDQPGVLFISDDEPALSVNEPMYFIAGGSSDFSARFQLSFKYRIFDPDSFLVEWLPLLSGIYMGYTQTSIWDLGEDSAPFRDTSYRPSLFWQVAIINEAWKPELLRFGYEHESNGKNGIDSRSLDTLFLQTVWNFDFADDWKLTIAPKFYGYINKSGHNNDIQRYRGFADWIIRFGREEGLLLATKLRLGTRGHGSAELDVSYPLRKPLFSRTGGFLHLQLFDGYGESLLDYDRDSDTQIRLGLSIVR